jgi:hypothetical protein
MRNYRVKSGIRSFRKEGYDYLDRLRHTSIFVAKFTRHNFVEKLSSLERNLRNETTSRYFILAVTVLA